MNIRVMGYRRAMQHEPAVPTLAIRIFDSPPDAENSPKNALRSSGLYSVLPYTFDDLDITEMLKNDPDTDLIRLRQKYTVFDRQLARRVIKEFRMEMQGKLELLVHCTMGASRSPAVAIALNEIFQLGNNTEEMKAKYTCINAYVYNVMMEAA